MANTQRLLNYNAPYPSPSPLPGLREAKLHDAVPGYADLAVSSQGVTPGPAAHNVATALEDIENGGRADTHAAAQAIAGTHPADRYGRVKDLKVDYSIVRKQAEQLPPGVVPPPPRPRPPVQKFLHKCADAGRATSHFAKKTKHHGHYEIPPSSALAFLAGAYGRSTLFRLAVNEAAVPDFDRIAKEIDNAPFFDANCLRAAVEYAAAEQAVGDQTVAGDMLRKAHHLIAIYLRSRRSDQIKAQATDLFSVTIQTIQFPMPAPALPAGEVTDLSRYFGSLVGLCLAGAFRYGKLDNEEKKKHRDRIVLTLNALATVIGGAAFPGVGALTQELAGFSQPFAEAVIKNNRVDEQTRALGADLIAILTANNGATFDAPACVEKLVNTVARCGFALQ